MPVRFQVDGDFYDHPKTTGMSSDAFKLWVRAGSFSAAKLTDGFVSDDVLAETLKADKEVASELVRRRLWRRVRGGYKFHQWGNRNLLKDQVEATRKADRDRKATKRRDEESQPAGNNVRPESRRNPQRIQPESKRIPVDSVYVSVSESVSGSGRGARRGPPDFGDEPPHRCPEHVDDPDPPPCGRCADARRGHERWERDRDLAKAEWERTAPRCRRHPTEFAHNCPNCRSEKLGAAA